MEVILLKNVANLGVLGDKVKVRSGYGRNYLVPSGFAVSATAENLEAFEARRAELERAAAEVQAAAEARKSLLDGIRLTIARKAGDEGRLFGSVGASDVAAAAVEAGYEVDKTEVRLSSGPFRTTGEYEIALHLYTDVDAVIKLDIIPEA
ncbi:50S ribosomal protein L9 [Thiocystis violascens]|uniref:Large ribosomal subunit protein bL9 n=1 Tax=Thiocystis violascens (strain ATCC 17096 / DSM 198 / 6111) TaxID=765911 RepID=I3Y892_THIV6|nr:50S ribosomal protein L9 [Thiocystis violascens]AFL73210.1 LSU ribosomal protein L9P [Thiocystis violascens DSM 198]